jgi:hypothetical protein
LHLQAAPFEDTESRVAPPEGNLSIAKGIYLG